MTVTAILKQKGSTKIVTIRPDATMEECVRMLAQYRIGALHVLLALLDAAAVTAAPVRARIRVGGRCGQAQREAGEDSESDAVQTVHADLQRCFRIHHACVVRRKNGAAVQFRRP